MSNADAHRHDPTHPVHARRRSSSRYPVEVIRSDKRNKTVSARIVDGVIRVRIPAWMTAEDEARFVDDVVERIERERRSNAIDLDARSRTLSDEYGLPYLSLIHI